MMMLGDVVVGDCDGDDDGSGLVLMMMLLTSSRTNMRMRMKRMMKMVVRSRTWCSVVVNRGHLAYCTIQIWALRYRGCVGDRFDAPLKATVVWMMCDE